MFSRWWTVPISAVCVFCLITALLLSNVQLKLSTSSLNYFFAEEKKNAFQNSRLVCSNSFVQLLIFFKEYLQNIQFYFEIGCWHQEWKYWASRQTKTYSFHRNCRFWNLIIFFRNLITFTSVCIASRFKFYCLFRFRHLQNCMFWYSNFWNEKRL